MVESQDQAATTTPQMQPSAPDLTDEQKKEIEHLWKTNRAFRKTMLSRRFSATAIKPKL